MWDKPEFPSIPSGVPVSFLYCVSQYPTPLERLHLGQVDFTRYAGLSDHTALFHSHSFLITRIEIGRV